MALVEGEHFVVDAGLLGVALGALLATLTRAVGVSAVVSDAPRGGAGVTDAARGGAGVGDSARGGLTVTDD